MSQRGLRLLARDMLVESHVKLQGISGLVPPAMEHVKAELHEVELFIGASSRLLSTTEDDDVLWRKWRFRPIGVKGRGSWSPWRFYYGTREETKEQWNAFVDALNARVEWDLEIREATESDVRESAV